MQSSEVGAAAAWYRVRYFHPFTCSLLLLQPHTLFCVAPQLSSSSAAGKRLGQNKRRGEDYAQTLQAPSHIEAVMYEKSSTFAHSLDFTPFRCRPLLLKWLAAFCVLECVGAAALSSPSPAPQKRPVECGKPGHCSEAAGLKDPNKGHEVRCCSDVQPVQKSTEGDPYPWARNAGCSVWGGSDEGSNWQCSKNKTFAEAEAICRAASARLCTTKELVAGCAAGTGCGYDWQLVWAVPTPPLSLSLERPVVTLVEPNQKVYYPLHFPEGSPWCGSGKPTYWWTGHHSGDPFYCEESEGVWVQGQPYMSPQDRHGCGVVDVDQDGLDDVVCAVGTPFLGLIRSKGLLTRTRT